MTDFIEQFGVWGGLGLAVAQILAFAIVLLISLAFLLLMDRKVWAAVQMRKGMAIPCRAFTLHGAPAQVLSRLS